jgi:hypothetical protein
VANDAGLIGGSVPGHLGAGRHLGEGRRASGRTLLPALQHLLALQRAELEQLPGEEALDVLRDLLQPGEKRSGSVAATVASWSVPTGAPPRRARPTLGGRRRVEVRASRRASRRSAVLGTHVVEQGLQVGRHRTPHR